jgi:hypothetical protein
MRAGANGVEELEKTFRGRGLTFRHFENATCECLRFQAGRVVVERAIVPAHVGTGGRRYELKVEKFFLIACASTSEQLAELLEQKPNAAPPPYRELLG